MTLLELEECSLELPSPAEDPNPAQTCLSHHLSQLSSRFQGKGPT